MERGDQDVFTQNLLKQLWRVYTDFGDNGKLHGAQQRMADVLQVSKPTLNAILHGDRPGTGKGSDGRTFIEKVWHYAMYGNSEPDMELGNALIAYVFADPAFLPE